MVCTVMTRFIYKICPAQDWARAVRAGVYLGSEDDIRDGYIHFSTLEQVAGTLKKFFAGQSGLLLIQVEAAKLGDALKWEPSRNDALFPHLYGQLEASADLKTAEIELGANGHIVPTMEED